MPFPTTPILDTFNRPNEGPPPGASWITPIWHNGMRVESNLATVEAGHVSGAAYWGAPVGPDCEVYITDALATTITFLYIRGSAPAVFPYVGYRVSVTPGPGGWWTVETRPAGLVLMGGLFTFSPGDSFGIQCIGSFLSTYYRPAGGVWVQVGSVTDATYLGAGYIGFGGSGYFENFGGGGYSPPIQSRRRSTPMSTYAQTGYSRVFLIEGRAYPDHTPTYQSCLKAGSPSQSFGDVEKIECPSPDEWGKWVEVGRVRGATERMTLPLSGRYAADVKSELLRLAYKGCPVDVHVHFGECTDPKSFTSFTKALVFEDAVLTSWGTEDLGALGSGDASKIDENSDISAASGYEVLPLAFAEKAADVVTNEVTAGVICDAASCGSCTDESDGCQKIYFGTKGAGGSAGTPPDVVFSVDKAVSWYAHDIDSWATTVDVAGLKCVGNYLVAVATSSTDPMAYALKADITPTNDEVWADSTTGFVVAGTPRAIWSYGVGAFIVGSAGYIYETVDPTAGVVVLDAGAATTSNLNAVHGLDSNFAVAVGNAGAIVKTEDGSIWSKVTPANISFVATDFTAVWVRSKLVWLLGTGGGRLYYTLDGGKTFYEKPFTGSGTGKVWDLQFSTASVGYMAHATTTPRGRILRTFDGGYSWVVLPESIGTLALNDRITALAVCKTDANFVVGGGLADNGTDGIIVVGKA